MASDGQPCEPCKVVIVLHVGDHQVKKIWRFDSLRSYTRDEVEKLLIELFPDISAKKFRLDLSYKDDLAGEVAIESDADLELALQSFIEKESENEDIKYRTLHVKECLVPTMKQGGKSFWHTKLQEYIYCVSSIIQ